MNRNFEDRKSRKVYLKSKENNAIIKALNMYGRVPEQWELLEEIERLNNIIKEVREYIESYMPNYDFDKTNLIKLLEMLDKGD